MSSDGSPGGGGGRFATTRWSVVLAARDRRAVGADRALSMLYGTYWYPLYAFARRRGLDAEEARDAAQGFFTKLLEKDTLRHARPERGRFRSFLLASFKHYLADERDRAQASKRGGGQPLLSIDWSDAEGHYAREPAEVTTPEKLFERRWALTVLRLALERLREEYSGPRRQRIFQRLKGYLAPAGTETPYRAAAADLGLSEIGVRVAVHRLRSRYRAILIEEIAQTLATGEDTEDELQYLLRAVE